MRNYELSLHDGNSYDMKDKPKDRVHLNLFECHIDWLEEKSASKSEIVRLALSDFISEEKSKKTGTEDSSRKEDAINGNIVRHSS